MVMDNHSSGDVIDSSAAPYLNSLVSACATFTESTAITHPSEPNYLALYSGSTQGQPWQGLTVKERAPKTGYADLRVQCVRVDPAERNV